MSSDQILAAFITLWAVIDPIGTVPVFIHATKGWSPKEKNKTALIAASAAAGILLFFIIVGELMLKAMGVPLTAFQIAGGLILFLFALTMIFGESKPERDSKNVSNSPQQTAIFPLATPSIASPGAMMAVVLLTDNSRVSILEQTIVALSMIAVVTAAYLLMLSSKSISKLIGEAGASLVSRVMGMILASIAATNVLEGIKEYFQ